VPRILGAAEDLAAYSKLCTEFPLCECYSPPIVSSGAGKDQSYAYASSQEGP
jgi:hypothetical protein